MSKFHIFPILFGLIILFAPQTFASDATTLDTTILKVSSSVSEVAINQPVTIVLELCMNFNKVNITSLDAKFLLTDSTSEYTAIVDGNNQTLQIITEESIVDGVISIVGGQPDGITPMSLPSTGTNETIVPPDYSCVPLATVEIIPKSLGYIIISVDFKNSQLLGEGEVDLDSSREASLEDGTELKISVVEEVSGPLATIEDNLEILEEAPNPQTTEHDSAVLEEPDVIVIPELHNIAIITPQPTAYIVQEPQQQSYTHTGTGPEHIIIGIISLVLIGWFYLRKKLA